MNQFSKLTGIVALAGFSLFASAALAQDMTPAPVEPGAVAVLEDTAGNQIGEFTFTAYDYRILINGQVQGLEPGFHGFHIHETGSCEDSGEGAFTAAGGHMSVGSMEGMSHPSHSGDMSSLLVLADNTAYLSLSTDRYTIDDLFDDDGSALIIHAGPDNFANIPERYGMPDEATLRTGDSGGRVACAVIVPAQPAAEVTPAS